MAWIESHDSLETHPKLLALAAGMSWGRFEASGRLHAFWKWCLKYATTGDLHKFNDATIGGSVELNGEDAKRFVKVMTSDQSCWIDRGRGPNGESIFRVHDWPDFTRYYIKDSLFKRKPKLWGEVLAVYAVTLVREQSPDCPRTVGHTKPNPTKPTNDLVHAREEDLPPNPPHDPKWPERIAAINGWYCEQMGHTPRLDTGVESLWMAWFLGGFEEDDFKAVFKFKRANVTERGDHPGCLRLSNILEPNRFREDLMLAKQGFKAHANNRTNNQPRTDRNAGTANEGKAGQYAGVGKVGKV